MIVKFSEIQELRCTHKFSEGLRYRPDTGSQGNPAFVPERSQLILLHSCVMIRRPDTSGERIRFIFSRIVSYNRSRTPRVASREMGRPTVFQTEYRPAAGLSEAYC